MEEALVRKPCSRAERIEESGKVGYFLDIYEKKEKEWRKGRKTEREEGEEKIMTSVEHR